MGQQVEWRGDRKCQAPLRRTEGDVCTVRLLRGHWLFSASARRWIARRADRNGPRAHIGGRGRASKHVWADSEKDKWDTKWRLVREKEDDLHKHGK